MKRSLATTLLLTLAAIASLFAAVSGAQAAVRTGPITYYLEGDQPLSLPDAAKLADEGRFSPLQLSEPDFGVREGAIWLRLPMETMGSGEIDLVALFETNFVTGLRAELQNGDGTALILEQTTEMPFDTRPIAYHQLAAPFQVAAGEDAVLWVRYHSSGTTALPTSVMTMANFNRLTNAKIATDFLFFGIIGMFLLGSIAAYVLTPGRIFLAYFAYAGSVVFYLAHRDGYTFQYLWPDAPEWNAFASLPVGAFMLCASVAFARAYLQMSGGRSEDRSGADAFFGGAILLTVGLLLLSPVADVDRLKHIMILTGSAMGVLLLGIGIIEYRRGSVGASFFVLGWLGMVSASTTTFAVHWLGMDIPRAQTLDVIRYAMVFDAFMMALASISGVIRINRERTELKQQQEHAARKNEELERRLGRVEKNYQLSQALALRSSQTLADTTHDLRQPLYALRAMLKGGAPGDAANRLQLDGIESSISYMEKVVEQALSSASSAYDSCQDRTFPAEGSFPATRLCRAVHAMFEADAQERGVDIRCVDSSVLIDVPSLVVLRIVSNFVSNALNYGTGNRIVVGVRRLSGAVALEVHNRGGGPLPAMGSDTVQRGQRGEESAARNPTGAGLGLAIVDDLARRHDLAWELTTRGEAGHVARLIVPLPPKAAHLGTASFAALPSN